MTDGPSLEGPSRLPSLDPRYRRMAEWRQCRLAAPAGCAAGSAGSAAPVVATRYRPRPFVPSRIPPDRGGGSSSVHRYGDRKMKFNTEREVLRMHPLPDPG